MVFAGAPLRRARARAAPAHAGPGVSTDCPRSRWVWIAAACAVVLLAWPVGGAAAAPAGSPLERPGAATGAAVPDVVEPPPRASATAVGPVVDGLDDRFASPWSRLAAGDWTGPVSLVLVGYTRQAAADPLDHDTRQRVYEQVTETPGAHIAAIVDRTGVPRSTVRYHLRVLEDAGLLAGGMVRGKHRYAPTDTDLAVAAALHDVPTRSVLTAVARYGPVSVSGLADETGRAVSTVAHHVDHLVEADLVERERGAGQVGLELGPAATAVLDRPPGEAGEVGDRAGRPAVWAAR